MARRTTASSAARIALVATALLLPTLSMIPLGGLYLWEHGLLLYWALGAALCVSIVYVAQRWLFSTTVPGVVPVPQDAGALHPTWTPLEQKAWGDVRAIATSVDIDKLDDTRALMDLAHRTVNAVANRIHADKEDALWQFTMPEALAIMERVSGRLNVFITENIPFGEKLTVSQVLQIYRWRSVADVAERAYNLWRIVRLSNPATALTNEARERLSRAMMQWGREHVARRLAETFVEEVGRAAIDLYGGRLKISHSEFYSEDLHAAHNQSGAADINVEPVDMAVVCENVSDRAAIAALLDSMEQKRSAAVTAFLRGETASNRHLGFPRLVVHIISNTQASTGYATPAASDVAAARHATVILLIPSRAGRLSSFEQSALTEIASNARVSPPVLLPAFAATASQSQSGAVSDMDYPGTVLAPIDLSLSSSESGANGDVIWSALDAAADDIRRIRLLRRIDRTKAGPGWKNTGWQAAKAAGRLTKSILTRRT